MTRGSQRPANATTYLALPRNLAAHARQRGRRQWLGSLPAIVDRSRERWQLDAVGDPFQPGGQTAWVAPVHSRTFGDAVLKVAARHEEAIDEAKGLRVWSGAGAVRLLAAEDVDDQTAVLLLERCRPGSWLADEPDATQDEVIAGLLRRLWVAPPATESFRPLSDMCEFWATASERWTYEHADELDPVLMREGTELFRTLGRRESTRTLLCTDLHAENVLSAEREPWLMIDPKPYVGDPAYDALQHILNGVTEFGRDPQSMVDRMAGLLDLDAEHLRLWLFARCVVGASDWPELLAVARQLAPS